MAVFNTYSKRKKRRENSGSVDVFTYDVLFEPLRIQILHILKESIGPYRKPTPYSVHEIPSNNTAWELLNNVLCREFGVLHLIKAGQDPAQQCLEFLLTSKDTDKVLDLIELTFNYIHKALATYRPYDLQECGITQNPSDAIEELNERFREHGVGYEFINGELIRIDSQLIHQEAVIPALTLLRTPGFEGAEEEFRKAHEHFRHRRYKESLNEGLKAFESTLKVICKAKDWEHRSGATASELIDTIFKNGLIPAELTSHFTGIRTTLESGIPTIRNRKAGHGQGTSQIVVPSHLVAYGLHITASAIVMVVEAHSAQE